MHPRNRQPLRSLPDIAAGLQATSLIPLEPRLLMTAEVAAGPIRHLHLTSPEPRHAEPSSLPSNTSESVVQASYYHGPTLRPFKAPKLSFERSVATKLAVTNELHFPVRLVISNITNSDWSGVSRPDKNLNNVVIPARESITRREEINYYASTPVFKMTVLNARDGRTIAESNVVNLGENAISLVNPLKIPGWRLNTKEASDAGRFPDQAGRPVYFYSPGTFYYKNAQRDEAGGTTGFYHNKLVLGTEAPAVYKSLIHPLGFVQDLKNISL